MYTPAPGGSAEGRITTAAVGAPDANGNSVGFVGVLDLDFGDLRPVVTGFQSPHGMGFVKMRGDDDDGGGGCDATRSSAPLD